jgi:elongation factor 1-gamma
VLLLIKQFTTFNIVELDKISESNIKKLNEKSPTRTFPLLRNGEFYISGTLAIINYLALNDEKFAGMLGKEKNEKAEVCMWLNYITCQIWPFYEHIIGQITGSMQRNDEVFNTAGQDLMSILGNINENLKFKSFLVGSNVTLADLFLSFSLFPYYSMILTDECKSKLPCVTRLFLYTTNIKQLQAVLGKPRLCHVAHKPTDVPFKEVSKQKEQPQIKEQPKSKENPKLKTKPKEVTSPETKPRKEIIDEIEEQKEKKKNPLDLLPPSLFELDQFKKEFLNTNEKKQIIDNFWKRFDPEGFSLWFVHYLKSPEQGKLAFKTKNLRSNFLQKIDNFRKYTFAVHGVYGQEPDLEIEGVWMWRGKDIPEEVDYIND